MLNHNLVNIIWCKYWKNIFNNVLYHLDEIKYQTYRDITYLTIYNDNPVRYIYSNYKKYLEFEKHEAKINKHWNLSKNEIEWWMVKYSREDTHNHNVNIIKLFGY